MIFVFIHIMVHLTSTTSSVFVTLNLDLQEEFEKLRVSFINICSQSGDPPLAELKDSIMSLLLPDIPLEQGPDIPFNQYSLSLIIKRLSIEELSQLLFNTLCNWNDISFLEATRYCFSSPLLEIQKDLQDYKKKLQVFQSTPLTHVTQLMTQDDYSTPEGFLPLVLHLENKDYSLSDVIAFRNKMVDLMSLPPHLVIFHSWKSGVGSVSLFYHTLKEFKNYLITKAEAIEVKEALRQNHVIALDKIIFTVQTVCSKFTSLYSYLVSKFLIFVSLYMVPLILL